VAHYEYDAFGKTTAKSGPEADSNPFRFSTKYLDEETGFYYYLFRHYQPELGRWASRDPIAEWGGANLYGFVKNEPIGWWDRLGLSPIDDALAFIALILEEIASGVGDDRVGDLPSDGSGVNDFVTHYFTGNGLDFDLIARGYGDVLKEAVEPEAKEELTTKIGEIAEGLCGTGFIQHKITNASNQARIRTNPDLTSVIFSVGDTTLFSDVEGQLCVDCDNRVWHFRGTRFHDIDDDFTDPFGLDQITMGLFPGTGDIPFVSEPYDIVASWQDQFTTTGTF